MPWRDVIEHTNVILVILGIPVAKIRWFLSLRETVLSHAGLLNGTISDTSKTMGSFV